MLITSPSGPTKQFEKLLFALFTFPLLMLSDMEDAHTQILSMKEDKDAAFFAVFDGHGGNLIFVL